MKGHFFTVVKKVAAGYLLIVIFSLIAIGYALTGLHTQTRRSEHLVSVDVKTLNLLRSLQQNLLAQQNLERQALLLQDREILSLFTLRRDDLSQLWTERQVISPAEWSPLTSLIARHQEQTAAGIEMMEQDQWAQAQKFDKDTESLHPQLLSTLASLIEQKGNDIDQGLSLLTRESANAYRNTWLLAFLGIFLSAPVSLAVILSIHRSVNALLQAIREISAGEFDYEVPIRQRDEFGTLAVAFAHMGQKLKEMDQLSLDANPLTHLPGNLALERELEYRINSGHPFAQLYIDLDHFKAYNDRYGYQAGSDAIARTAQLIRETDAAKGTPHDLIAHIGGDDYAILTQPRNAESIAKELIEKFDLMAPTLYTEEDARAGEFVGKDRFGVERVFSLLTVSISIINSEGLQEPTPALIGRECARMKDHLKNMPGSNYMINRRACLERSQ